MTGGGEEDAVDKSDVRGVHVSRSRLGQKQAGAAYVELQSRSRGDQSYKYIHCGPKYRSPQCLTQCRGRTQPWQVHGRSQDPQGPHSTP